MLIAVFNFKCFFSGAAKIINILEAWEILRGKKKLLKKLVVKNRASFHKNCDGYTNVVRADAALFTNFVSRPYKRA